MAAQPLLHPVWPSIISGQRLLNAPTEFPDHLAEEAATHTKIIAGVGEIAGSARVNAVAAGPPRYFLRRGRQQLHQAERPGPGDCLGIESRLLADEGHH